MMLQKKSSLMPNFDAELPIEALPGMVRVMNYFHLALTDEIKNYEESGDQKKFQAIFPMASLAHPSRFRP